MIKIEGHGIPTKFKQGERGTIYTDLDTGRKYKCLGTKGFVTNSDDEDAPVYYHWQLLEGGNISWDDIPDKPFGETTVMSDTWTWNDNNKPELIYLNDAANDDKWGYYHISNETPTLSDFANGFKVVYSKKSEEFPPEIMQEVMQEFEDGIIMDFEQYIMVVPYDKMQVFNTFVEKKGIYLFDGTHPVDHLDKGQPISITIPGYKGFEMSGVKTLDPKYIPFGGVMIVNLTHEGWNDDHELINPKLDRTYTEIMSVIENGGFAYIKLSPGEIGYFYLQLVRILTWPGQTTLSFGTADNAERYTVEIGDNNEIFAWLESVN
jgi:hypothetical protein